MYGKKILPALLEMNWKRANIHLTSHTLITYISRIFTYAPTVIAAVCDMWFRGKERASEREREKYQFMIYEHEEKIYKFTIVEKIYDFLLDKSIYFLVPTTTTTTTTVCNSVKHFTISQCARMFHYKPNNSNKQHKKLIKINHVHLQYEMLAGMRRFNVRIARYKILRIMWTYFIDLFSPSNTLLRRWQRWRLSEMGLKNLFN